MQLLRPMRQDLLQVLARVRMPGEEQHHLVLLQDSHDARGIDGAARGLLPGPLGLGPCGHQIQDAHGGVIVVQQRCLRSLKNQFLEGRLGAGQRLGHDVPLRGVGQRHVQIGLQALQPVKRHARAVAQQRQHARTAVVVLGIKHARGQHGGEDGIAQATAQAAELVDGGRNRSLPYHLDQGARGRVVDLARLALWAQVPRVQIDQAHLHHGRVAIGLCAVASVTGGGNPRPWHSRIGLGRLGAWGRRGNACAASLHQREQIALALGAGAKQHVAKALDRCLGVLQRPHHVHKGTQHPL